MADPQYVNYYRCPDDGTQWTMVWSCKCDDRCPSCNHEVVPYKSEEAALNDAGAIARNS